MNNKKTDKVYIFEQYPIWKAFLVLCIPTVITQLIIIIYNYADTWYLGRIENSTLAVASLGVIMPIYVIMAAIANLFGVGGASLIARYLGIKENKKAKNVFAYSLYGGLLFAVIYSLILLIFHKPLIYLVGGTDETYDMIYTYMIITMIIGSIPTILNNLFGHLVRSVGASFHSSFGTSLGAILNIILDPLFMFVFFKGNEIVGVGLATLISNMIALLYFIIYILTHKKNSEVYTLSPKDIRANKNITKEVLLIGFPAFLSTTLAMVSNIFANVLINKPTNAAALAGLNVAKKANMLAFNMLLGITQGMLPFVAFNYASGNIKRRTDGIKMMYFVSVSFALVMMGIYLIFTKGIITFFIPKETEAINYGVSFLHVLAYAAPLCAISYSTNTIFQATGKKICAFVLSILRKGLLDIPLMYLFKYAFDMGNTGVTLATPVAEILSVLVSIILLIIISKKLKQEKMEEI